jgi:hypothetical protein
MHRPPDIDQVSSEVLLSTAPKGINLIDLRLTLGQKITRSIFHAIEFEKERLKEEIVTPVVL